MEWEWRLVELKWKPQVTTVELVSGSPVVLVIPLANSFCVAPVVNAGPGDPSGAI